MAYNKCMTFIFLILTTFWTHASELRPFVSDGCTMAPDGTRRDRDKWKECCVAHDLRLWGGGTKEQRIEADNMLRSCMKEKSNPHIAFLFWLGVRLGSYSPFKLTNKKWGNAWPEQIGYRALTQDEINQLINEVQELEIDPRIKDDYVLELYSRN